MTATAGEPNLGTTTLGASVVSIAWIFAVAAAAATAAAVGIGVIAVDVRGCAAPPIMASAVVMALPTRKY